MGTVNLVKLIELYKEILSTYITEDGVLIATNDMTDKDILDRLADKNYIVGVIEAIENKFIEQGELVLVGNRVDELMKTIQLDVNFKEHPCLFKIHYTLYKKIIHLQQKG